MWRPPMGSLAGSCSNAASAAVGSSTGNLLEFLEHDESPNARTVFVGNLDARVTRKMLYELMLQAGPVEAVRIVPPRDKIPRTIAFVRYEHAVSVRYALLVLRDVKLFRSSISLNFSGINKARPRPDYPPWPTTFFEIPPGFEKFSDKKRELMAKKKAVPDLTEYHTGYFLRKNEEEEEDSEENSEDDNFYKNSRKSQRNRQSDNFRFNQRDDFPRRGRGRGEHSSFHSYRRSPSEEPPRKNQHIRFDEKNFEKKLEKKIDFDDSERDSFRRNRKAARRNKDVVDDGGGGGGGGKNEQRSRRSGKKSKKEHRSSSSKRKRTH